MVGVACRGAPAPALARRCSCRAASGRTGRRGQQRPVCHGYAADPAALHGPSRSKGLVASCLWPDAYDTRHPSRGPSWAAYLEMARLQNVAPSFLLVFIGALRVTHSWGVLLMPAVWAMAFVSAGIAVSSVIVNDYFDFRTGVDVVNSPHKPLPLGTVTPDGAILVASTLYIAVLIVGCVLDVALLRWTIAAAAAATLLYTPLLKRVTAVKNLAVAFIIAASPLCGALAAGGAAPAGLSATATAQVAPLAAVLFLLVTYREILMDINDRVGDAAADVRTLPVALGPHAALAVAAACVAAATAVGFTSIHGAAPASALLAAPAAHAAAVALFLLGMLPAWLAVCDVARTRFDKDVVSAAIGGSFKSIAVGLLVLTLVR